MQGQPKICQMDPTVFFSLSISYLAATMHLQFPILWSQERVFHLPYAARSVSTTFPHWRGFKKHTSLFLFLYTQQTHTLSQALSRKVTKQLPKSLSSNCSKARALTLERHSKKKASVSFHNLTHSLSLPFDFLAGSLSLQIQQTPTRGCDY